MEMLLVLFLLSLALAAIGIQVGRFLQEQYFLSDVERVTHELETAQDLMLVLDRDIELRMIFDREKKGIVYLLSVKQGLEGAWKRVLERRHKPLEGIKDIVYESPHGDYQTDKGGITLQFHAGGIGMSTGTLTLTGSIKGLEHVIMLKGYPTPFESQRESRGLSSYEERQRDHALRNVLRDLLGEEE